MRTRINEEQHKLLKTTRKITKELRLRGQELDAEQVVNDMWQKIYDALAVKKEDTVVFIDYELGDFVHFRVGQVLKDEEIDFVLRRLEGSRSKYKSRLAVSVNSDGDAYLVERE